MGLVTVLKEEVINTLRALAQATASASASADYLLGYHNALRDVARSLGHDLTLSPGQWERVERKGHHVNGV